MRQKKLKLSTVLMLSLGLTGLKAQEAIPATGGNASGSGGSISYSVGQIVYTTNAGLTGTAAQGVQQPYEISVVSSVEQVKGLSLKCSAFPNPTTDKLILKIEGVEKTQYVASLYNINGRLLVTKKVENSETTIAIDNFVSATYFLKITQGNKEIKSFKIIKNK